ncbi:MAG: hypothetical protein KDA81_18550, partial [Planctomycetaceae bacterium]|nr:hypothetical protein [Planctomycetaceae bacterium]
HFDRVLVTQMSPGEIAIVAGTSADSLLDEGLLTRLSRSHVSRVLTQCGWDWSQVAALPVVDTNDPVGIFEHEPKRSESLASHGFSAFSLPLEVMRWADKSGELKQTFGPHQLRMADAAPRSDLYAEFARRYSSVIQQQEILTAFPDQPWAYRRSLKMEMQRNPRPPVETIRDGNIVRQANPVDEYRKDYFETLGRVLQMAAAGDADPLSLRQLNRFTFTCEPLISHFAHHELVRIHELTGHQSPALELRHRLHTVYFTEPGDMSVRQVAAALEQILDDPELLPSDEQRFDQTNSLLQQLVVRWQRRQGYEPPSARQTQQDVDHSVSVANRALEKMRTWAAAVGVDEAALRHRRQYVNKALVAPLRTYRDQVLAHRIRTETPTQSDSAIDSDLPLLLDPSGLTTN